MAAKVDQIGWILVALLVYIPRVAAGIVVFSSIKAKRCQPRNLISI